MKGQTSKWCKCGNYSRGIRGVFRSWTENCCKRCGNGAPAEADRGRGIYLWNGTKWRYVVVTSRHSCDICVIRMSCHPILIGEWVRLRVRLTQAKRYLDHQWPISSSLYGYTIIKVLWCKIYPMCCHLTWLFLINRLHVFASVLSLGKLWQWMRWLQSATSHTLMSSIFFLLALLACSTLYNINYYMKNNEDHLHKIRKLEQHGIFWRWRTSVRFLVLSQIHDTLMICLHALHLN